MHTLVHHNVISCSTIQYPHNWLLRNQHCVHKNRRTNRRGAHRFGSGPYIYVFQCKDHCSQFFQHSNNRHITLNWIFDSINGHTAIEIRSYYMLRVHRLAFYWYMWHSRRCKSPYDTLYAMPCRACIILPRCVCVCNAHLKLALGLKGNRHTYPPFKWHYYTCIHTHYVHLQIL